MMYRWLTARAGRGATTNRGTCRLFLGIGIGGGGRSCAVARSLRLPDQTARLVAALSATTGDPASAILLLKG